MQQVDARKAAGMANSRDDGLTRSVGMIVLKNTLTLFNLIFIFLAVVIVMVGHAKNILFIGVVICNTGMGIFQELRAKKTLDKLSVLAEATVTAMRDGMSVTLPQHGVVLDDILLLSAGDQVCADGVIMSASGLEADESLLTGESDRIRKTVGDTVLSGSFITAGHAHMRVMAVGADNYANSLTAQAKKLKKNRSKLLAMLGWIIRVMAVIIIPLGVLLFTSSYYGDGETLESAVLGSSAAVVGMLPGGLVLLTGVTLTVGALNLARRRALVQSLPSIETLARVDVLCLDKTGTITTGSLALEKMELMEGADGEWARRAVAELMGALKDKNATAKALQKEFGQSTEWQVIAQMPFASDRKWSGATYNKIGSYVLGAPGIVLAGTNSPALLMANEWAERGFRVVCLAYTEQALSGTELPPGLRCAALLILTDSIRPDAVETFKYFEREGVTLKVISGDNPRTVGAVAQKAGIAGADRAIDMNGVKDADYTAIADEYTVFGHVSPRQKLELIRAMRKSGRTTCMTGDGVNDILAMREADCSVAMVSGSSAARSACDFVLLSSNFGAMIGVLKEGRRVINNIERVAALYLVNTIFSTLLLLIYSFLPFPYPYAPLQMTPVNALTTGIPSFFLALQANYARPMGKFFSNIFEHALPAGLAIVFNTLYIQLAGFMFGLPNEEISSMVIFLVGVVGFFMLFRVARPYTKRIKIMLGILLGCFAVVFLFLSGFFMLGGLIGRNIFFYLPMVYFSFHVHAFLGKCSCRFLGWINRLKSRHVRR